MKRVLAAKEEEDAVVFVQVLLGRQWVWGWYRWRKKGYGCGEKVGTGGQTVSLLAQPCRRVLTNLFLVNKCILACELGFGISLHGLAIASYI